MSRPGIGIGIDAIGIDAIGTRIGAGTRSTTATTMPVPPRMATTTCRRRGIGAIRGAPPAQTTTTPSTDLLATGLILTEASGAHRRVKSTD